MKIEASFGKSSGTPPAPAGVFTKKAKKILKKSKNSPRIGGPGQVIP